MRVRVMLALLLSSTFLITAAPPAAAVVLDRHCEKAGPDVNWCASVVRKPSGRIVFRVSTSAYFQPMEACVWKGNSRVTCHAISGLATDGNTYFVYKVSWQGNFPNLGAGTYYVEMHITAGGAPLTGGNLSFRVS